MNHEHLIRMANQIGDFFSSQPDESEAMEGCANHIARSWERRMRHELAAILKTAEGDQVQPFVRTALTKHGVLA
jgi:formate dehydrogenase subunit delta